jgi:hypothetical protein
MHPQSSTDYRLRLCFRAGFRGHSSVDYGLQQTLKGLVLVVEPIYIRTFLNLIEICNDYIACVVDE